MKWIFLLLSFSVAYPCAAQQHRIIQELTQIGVKRSAEQLSSRAARQARIPCRVVQGKILPGGKPMLSKGVAEIERYIFSTPRLRGITLLEEPTAAQMRKALTEYHQVMESFQNFKKEMDVFLYYQSKEDEKRTLSAVEKAELMGKISRMHGKLSSLKTFISSEDPAYRAAREYVAYAAELVSPTMRGMWLKSLDQRADRQYRGEEFFLHTPKANQDASWKGLLPGAVRVRQVAEKLPPGLKMAVLNDRWSVIARMRQMHLSGKFLPGWDIAYYEDTAALLYDVTHAGKKFDVILTDIIVPGGGGCYLTGELRKKGFSGVIIALAAFEEENKMGKRLFDMGFDGMISMPMMFENGSHWPLQIMKNLQSYFYYRDTNGWKR